MNSNNSMKRSVLATIIIAAVGFVFQTVNAQNYTSEDFISEGELSPKENLLNAVLPTYPSWKRAELSGKLKAAGLPLNPTVKVFMRRDSLLSISVRVPFLGEVGNIRVTRDSMLAVNKMKRVYCMESLGDIKYDYPKFLGDFQALLLGRIVVFKSGQLSKQNAEFIDIAYAQDSIAPDLRNWKLDFPKNRTPYDQFGYSYLVSENGKIDNLTAEIQAFDIQLAMDFSYPGSQSDMALILTKEEKQLFKANLIFDVPKWEGEIPAPVKINDKYTRVSISQFLKSF